MEVKDLLETVRKLSKDSTEFGKASMAINQAVCDCLVREATVEEMKQAVMREVDLWNVDVSYCCRNYRVTGDCVHIGTIGFTLIDYLEKDFKFAKSSKLNWERAHSFWLMQSGWNNEWEIESIIVKER